MAVDAMRSSYSPYSGFMVGAAVMSSDGKIYTGCNIENASYSATVCAERTAIFKAVSEGVRDFKMIAVAGGKGGVIDGAAMPCGVCRQVMAEFCRGDLPVLAVMSADGDYGEFTLKQLLPEAFGF